MNPATGVFTPVAGSPFATGGEPSSIAFSPNGNIAAVTNMGSNTVSVYTVNPATGVFTPVAGSPFATGKHPESITFSPNGNIAAVNNVGSNTVNIYEVNQETGEFKPITGDLLRPALEMKEFSESNAPEALRDPKAVGGIISQYLGATIAPKEKETEPEQGSKEAKYKAADELEKAHQTKKDK